MFFGNIRVFSAHTNIYLATIIMYNKYIHVCHDGTTVYKTNKYVRHPNVEFAFGRCFESPSSLLSSLLLPTSPSPPLPLYLSHTPTSPAQTLPRPLPHPPELSSLRSGRTYPVGRGRSRWQWRATASRRRRWPPRSPPVPSLRPRRIAPRTTRHRPTRTRCGPRWG